MGYAFHLIISTLLVWMSIASCSKKKEAPLEKGSNTENSLSIQEKVSDSLMQQKSIDETAPIAAIQRTPFKYDLAQPVQTSVLSSELIEISALTYDSDLDVLYAVNDEKGTLFTLNPSSGEIIDRMRFGKKGDYEGVEIGEAGLIYVVKSNGDISEIQKSSGETTKIKTALHSSNDVEGLGYNKQEQMLLIACKGYPSISKFDPKSKSEKAIYGWSTDTETLIEEPILKILDKDLVDYLESLNLDISKSKKKKYRKRVRNFSPSGIAYNESDGLYYMVSSVGKTLITVDAFSNIHHIEFLDDTYFAQPEGICFGKDNALYISNEGRSLVAKLMRFEVQ